MNEEQVKDDEGLTPEELESMTEEERKAFADEGESDGEKKEAGQEEKGRQAEEVTPESESAKQSTFVPFINLGAGEGIQEKLDALDKQLEEGDIDIIQYTKQRDPLIQQRTEAELAAKFNQQSSEQLWQYEQRLFFNSYPQYKDNPVLNGALGKVFKALDTQENASRTGFELLNQAREQVEAELATLYGSQKAPASSGESKTVAPVKGNKPAIEKVELPRTLAGVPAAEQSGTGQDDLSFIDALSGIEQERAIARLSPEQQERFTRI